MPADAIGPMLDCHPAVDDEVGDVSPAYLVALGVYAAVLPTLADHQVEARLRAALDRRRPADTRALLELTRRRIPQPSPSLAALLRRGDEAIGQRAPGADAPPV
jgi:hypothetical protein